MGKVGISNGNLLNLSPAKVLARWHDEATVQNGNAFVSTATKEQYGNIMIYQETPADADEFHVGVDLSAGTYSFHVLGVEGVDRGKIDWKLDNTTIVSGQDWYGVLTYNVKKTTTSISVSRAGNYTLKGVVNGKNASSSSYYIKLTKYWFERTA